MSTTFDIIPVETDKITFRQVIERSEKRINDFLRNNAGLNVELKLNVDLHENSEKYVHEIDLSSKFEWKKNEYVWFTIQGIAGGTDAYCEPIEDKRIDPQNPWWMLDEFKEQNTSISDFDEKLKAAKKLNKYWYFRRSAGQPGIINLSYGLIAAALAELTGGFISSTDGAWDYKKLPAEPKEFYKWYYIPEREENPDFKEWAQRSLKGLKEEIMSENK